MDFLVYICRLPFSEFKEDEEKKGKQKNLERGMRRRRRRRLTDSKVLFDSKKSYSPKGAEEKEDPDEEDALIYKGKGRRFGFQKRPFKA